MKRSGTKEAFLCLSLSRVKQLPLLLLSAHNLHLSPLFPKCFLCFSRHTQQQPLHSFQFHIFAPTDHKRLTCLNPTIAFLEQANNWPNLDQVSNRSPFLRAGKFSRKRSNSLARYSLIVSETCMWLGTRPSSQCTVWFSSSLRHVLSSEWLNILDIEVSL